MKNQIEKPIFSYSADVFLNAVELRNLIEKVKEKLKNLFLKK